MQSRKISEIHAAFQTAERGAQSECSRSSTLCWVSKAAETGILIAPKSLCNPPQIPQCITNWNQKREKSKPGALPDAHSGASKITIMAIIFKCLRFARPVAIALHGFLHLVFQQPHGAGTVTPFHRWADKPTWLNDLNSLS